MIQLAIKARPGTSLRERIENLSMPVPESGCWLWTAYISRYGYGLISVNGKTQRAHRIAFKAWKGPIDSSMTIDHLCRVRCCVNPDHLQAVTNRENLMRGNTRAAVNVEKTRCPEGHIYDLFNTYVSKPGTRSCRLCKRDDARRRRESHVQNRI